MENKKFNIFQPFTVTDAFRTNNLSRIPGGSTVILVKSNGQKLEYTNIKNISAYLKRAFNDEDVEYALVAGQIIKRKSSR